MINHVEDCRDLPLRDGRFYNPLSPDESGTDLEEPTTELPTQSPTKSPTQSPHPKNTNDLIDRDVIDRGDIKPPSIIISRDEIPDDHWEIDAPDNIQTKGKELYRFSIGQNF